MDGTCLCCGDIVEIGVDLADEHGEEAGYEPTTEGAENARGGGSEPTSAAARGASERWHRGWGRQPHKRVRKRKTGRGAVTTRGLRL